MDLRIARQCELHLPVTPQLLQQHGFVHGGVLSYVADNALTYAGGTAMRVPVVTSEFKINYLRPAVGELLIARAQAVHHGRAQAVCRCDVFVVQAGTEKLCAVAQGTIAHCHRAMAQRRPLRAPDGGKGWEHVPPHSCAVYSLFDSCWRMIHMRLRPF